MPLQAAETQLTSAWAASAATVCPVLTLGCHAGQLDVND
jgi:hypothetical protein